MTIGNIGEHLPRIVPEDEITVEDEVHDFTVLEYSDDSSSTKYVYTLDKAPVFSVVEVTGTVDGEAYTFTEGTDYDVVDDNNDGDLDSIDFDVGGEQPDDNTEFEATYRCRPIIDRYIETHEEESMSFDDLLDEVIDSRQVNNAEGDELEHIGSIFGVLGKRRSRNDQEYRAYLKSIVQSFSGRGTVPGLKFAIASGIGTDSDNVIIDEDFTEVGYEIRIENTDTSFITSVINDMADLADPSGVELLSAPVIVLDGETIQMQESGSTVTSSTTGLGGSTLTLDGQSSLQ